MTADVRITGGDQLRALAGELNRIPPKLKAQLRTRMRAAAEPMKTAVQRNALAISARGPGTGLRRQIAAATRIRVTTTPTDVTARVYIDSDAMPPGKEALPSLMEGFGWTHPVYGRGRTFQPGHAYFKSAVTRSLPGMRTAIDRAVDDTARSIQ